MQLCCNEPGLAATNEPHVRQSLFNPVHLILRASLRRSALPIVLLLTMALLFAQWTGLKHRIVHAAMTPLYLQSQSLPPSASSSQPDSQWQSQSQWQWQWQSPASTFGSGSDTDLSHSCLAFDAATVADSIHTPPFLLPLLTSAQVLSLWAAFISWDAPLSLCFSSRAPPPR
jgi:hypothetical protein